MAWRSEVLQGCPWTRRASERFWSRLFAAAPTRAACGHVLVTPALWTPTGCSAGVTRSRFPRPGRPGNARASGHLWSRLTGRRQGKVRKFQAVGQYFDTGVSRWLRDPKNVRVTLQRRPASNTGSWRRVKVARTNKKGVATFRVVAQGTYRYRVVSAGTARSWNGIPGRLSLILRTLRGSLCHLPRLRAAPATWDFGVAAPPRSRLTLAGDGTRGGWMTRHGGASASRGFFDPNRPDGRHDRSTRGPRGMGASGGLLPEKSTAKILRQRCFVESRGGAF